MQKYTLLHYLQIKNDLFLIKKRIFADSTRLFLITLLIGTDNVCIGAVFTFMELTEKHLKELEELSKEQECVKLLLEEWRSYTEDVTKIFYLSLTSAVKALSIELKCIGDGELSDFPILRSEDKFFERINALMKDSDKIFRGIAIGKDHIDPDAKQREKEQQDIVA